MTAAEILGLSGASVAAGVINAVAGGGTLVTFPTLLFFGVPPIVANATSTLALTIGTGGSVYGYRRHIPAVKHWLRWFVPVSILGGLAGSFWLTHTSNQTFARLVPFLILFATILFITQGFFRRIAGLEAHGGPPLRPALFGAVLFQFAVAVYGGYFGAGIGILMLASLGFIGLTDIFEMNALKTMLGSLVNLVASIWFIFAGLIDWPRVAVMALSAVLGYYLGSHYSQRIPQSRVRLLIAFIGVALFAMMFYRQFLR